MDIWCSSVLRRVRRDRSITHGDLDADQWGVRFSMRSLTDCLRHTICVDDAFSSSRMGVKYFVISVINACDFCYMANFMWHIEGWDKLSRCCKHMIIMPSLTLCSEWQYFWGHPCMEPQIIYSFCFPWRFIVLNLPIYAPYWEWSVHFVYNCLCKVLVWYCHVCNRTIWSYNSSFRRSNAYNAHNYEFTSINSYYTTPRPNSRWSVPQTPKSNDGHADDDHAWSSISTKQQCIAIGIKQTFCFFVTFCPKILNAGDKFEEQMRLSKCKKWRIPVSNFKIRPCQQLIKFRNSPKQMLAI